VSIRKYVSFKVPENGSIRLWMYIMAYLKQLQSCNDNDIVFEIVMVCGSETTKL
jgi:hypothetical protein